MVDNMPPVNEQAPTLDPEDGILLEKRGGIGPVINHRRLFSERAIASITSSSVASPNAYTDPHAELLPDQWQSREYVERLGCDADTAEELWRRWSKWLHDDEGIGLEPPTLASLAKEVMDSKEDDALNLSDDWHAVMKGWGISEELRAKIMDPEFETVRLTEGAKHWVLLAIQGREQRLDDIYVRSRNRVGRRLIRRLEKPLSAEGYTAEDVGETEDREDVVRIGTDEDGNIVDLDHDAANHNKGKQMSLPRTGWTSLWRPATRYLCKEVLRFHHLDCLGTYGPSDFHGRMGGFPPLYLYPSKDLATIYARYMASLIGGGSSTARLLRFDVPAYYIESLQPFFLACDAEYEDSPDTEMFKQIVHASRSGRRWPANLTACEEWPLLIGHICKSDVRAVSQLARWQDVSKDHLVKHEGAEWDDDEEGFEGETGFAIQYAFSGEETINRLVTEGELFIEKVGDSKMHLNRGTLAIAH